MNNITTKEPQSTFVKVTNQDKTTIGNFHKYLLEDEQIQNLNDNSTQDPNINYDILHEKIQTAKNLYMPEKFVRFNKYKHKKTKWITQSMGNKVALNW